MSSMNSGSEVQASPATEEALRRALKDANLPTLLSVLAHLTGDDRWIEDPYKPSRPRGAEDNDSGGFPEALQESIRKDAWEVISGVRAGTFQPADPPSPERIVRMLAVSVASPVAEAAGPLFAEELGIASREVPIPPSPARDRFRVLVIGTGFAGVLTSVQLAKAGIAHTVIEKNSGVGGTWWENRYPGAGVDTPSHIYSASSFQRHDWPHYFSKRDELQKYIESIVEANDIRRHIRFGTEVIEARWDEQGSVWRVQVRRPDGEIETLSANVVISGVGLLNRPAFPSIPGLETFQGPVIHTAQWRDDVDLRGKRVAVIGTGASAMQTVPAIADIAGRLIIFQRTAQWGLPNPNYFRKVSESTQLLMREVPHYLEWYRLRHLWNVGDKMHMMVKWDPEWPHSDRSINAMSDRVRIALTEYIRSELGARADELMPKCLPTYPPFGKRPLIDNGWFRTVAREDVDLVTDGIASIGRDRIVTTTGQEYPADIIIIATGFRVLQVLGPMEVYGRGNASLHEVWGEDDARAHLGITMPDFPNFFCILGPNTFAGHGGTGILTIELGLQYIMKMIRTMLAEGISSVDCRQDVHDAYNERLAEALSHTIWAHPGMTTYYRNSKGHIVVPMPWTNYEYWKMVHEPDLADFHVSRGG
ncbi:MAG: NAD(P)/FAD-dependent oxidoreductase [Reyranella sp.]|nr:NAD(P)/FAD-dependent oxidoreductase [Reyranella sp.]